MKNTKIILSKIAHSQRSESLRTSAALILTTLILLIAAATTAATARTYTDLFNLNRAHGYMPQPPAILAQGRDGNLYGTTDIGGPKADAGVVFRIMPSGTLKVLYGFNGGVNGGWPYSGLTLGTDGNFYGTTEGGGNTLCSDGCGTVFKITPRGSLTTLYMFTNGTDGSIPVAPPIQGTDGNFYGTTSGIEEEGAGTAYKITPSGSFTSLGSLPGASRAPLLQATDGNFYGTTFNGGSSNFGTVFKMTPNSPWCKFGFVNGKC